MFHTISGKQLDKPDVLGLENMLILRGAFEAQKYEFYEAFLKVGSPLTVMCDVF